MGEGFCQADEESKPEHSARVSITSQWEVTSSTCGCDISVPQRCLLHSHSSNMSDTPWVREESLSLSACCKSSPGSKSSAKKPRIRAQKTNSNLYHSRHKHLENHPKFTNSIPSGKFQQVFHLYLTLLLLRTDPRWFQQASFPSPFPASSSAQTEATLPFASSCLHGTMMQVAKVEAPHISWLALLHGLQLRNQHTHKPQHKSEATSLISTKPAWSWKMASTVAFVKQDTTLKTIRSGKKKKKI